MYRVAGGVAVIAPHPEPVEHEPPKKGAPIEVRQTDADRREPKPLIVEDNMATCG